MVNKCSYMQLAEKIFEGHHRECFAVAGKNLIVKKLKRRPKIFWIRADKLYRRNVNKEEYDFYRSLPSSLREYFPSYVELKDNMLIMERITDYEGEFSKTVLEYGKVTNEYFWKDVETIVEILTKERLWLFDIFHCGNNMVVKKVSEKVYRPVIIDFKRMGWHSYPLQINLLFESECRKKFHRRLKKFIKKFKG